MEIQQYERQLFSVSIRVERNIQSNLEKSVVNYGSDSESKVFLLEYLCSFGTNLNLWILPSQI